MSERDLSPDQARLLDALLAEREGKQVEGEETLPASRAQERLWELGKLAPDSAWGNLPLAFRVRGDLDLAALEAALVDLVARHPTLRMRYEEVGGRLVAHADRPAAPLLEVEALEGADAREGVGSPEAALAAALGRARALAARPVDPTRDPALRGRWCATGEGEGVLVLLTHHLAADGWALGLLLAELSSLYGARLAGRAPEAPPLDETYARVVRAERSAPPPGASELAYWEERLAGAPREVPLPGGGAIAGASATRSGHETGALDGAASVALRRAAADAGVTPFGAWLSLLGVSLASLTGEPDIVIGTTISDRASTERERLVANFGNNLLLRQQYDPDNTLADVWSAIAASLPRDLAHQGVALEDLMRRGTDGARPPRLNVLYMLRDGSPDDHFELVGCETTWLPVEAGASMLDLALDVQDRGEDGFAFAIEHREARLPSEEAALLARALERVARAVAERPGLSISGLPIEAGRWASRQATGTAPRQATGTAPRSPGAGDALRPAEAMLADLWREALELEAVDPLDNFFELGGHSLLAIDLLERIEERTGVRLTPVDLVSQTLAQLAGAIEEGMDEDGDEENEPESRGPRGWLGRLLRVGGDG